MLKYNRYMLEQYIKLSVMTFYKQILSTLNIKMNNNRKMNEQSSTEPCKINDMKMHNIQMNNIGAEMNDIEMANIEMANNINDTGTTKLLFKTSQHIDDNEKEMYSSDSKDYFSNVYKYLKTNYLGVISLGLCACFISYFTSKDYIKSIMTIFIITMITWCGHMLMHCKSNYNMLYLIHQHTHHSPFGETILGKIIEYSIMEFIFFGGGIALMFVILLQRIFKGNYLLNPYVILFWSLSVPLLHEFYYHMLKITDMHKKHHLNQNIGYSPDVWDVAFKTKEDGSKIENENKMVPLLFIVAVLTVLIFVNTPFDFIKYFHIS